MTNRIATASQPQSNRRKAIKTITLTLSKNFSIICASVALSASMAATMTGDSKYLGLAGVAGNMSFLGLCIDTKNSKNQSNKTQEITMKNIHIDANGLTYFRRTEGFGTIPDTSEENLYWKKYTAAEKVIVQAWLDAKALKEAEPVSPTETPQIEAKDQKQPITFKQLTLF